MAYYIYCLSSEYTNQHGTKKLGMTMYPIQRMYVYNTGDCPGIGLDKRYDAIWEVRATSREELFAIEEELHSQFQSNRLKRANGNNTEWFRITIEEVVAVLESYIVRTLTIDEIEEIHVKAAQCARVTEYMEEKQWKRDQNSQKQASLKTRFFNLFLPSIRPRRIQVELWDIVEQISHQDLAQLYKGIVQWPTGTGKTIAMLLLIVLIKESCARNGIIYRGILVTPKNDIFRTITSEFHKLSKFGITIYDGSHGKLSQLTIPSTTHILIMACPDSLRNEHHGMRLLPSITHLHFDEVHRITADIFFTQLQEMLVTWNTRFLTGTSATPKTSSTEQHRKLTELFGDPYPILHKCDVDEAVQNGWIAVPRFVIHITPKQTNPVIYNKALVDALAMTIEQKKTIGSWHGGKCIVYTPSITDAQSCALIAAQQLPDASVYLAVANRTDKEFVTAPADGTTRALFACDRYREGSDIKGIELTAVMVGNTISAYILIQIQGRSLRTDYANKEGWCLVVAACEDGETEYDVLDRIALDIITYLGNKSFTKKDITKIVATYFADVVMNGTVCTQEETISRIQAAYIRKEYLKKTPKEKYEVIQTVNREMNISSKEEYSARNAEHPHYIPDPRNYFKDNWISWYHFLGVDTSVFPQTKIEWVCLCKELRLTTWSLYKDAHNPQLPPNPSEMYEEYTNWDNEFCIRKPLIMRM